MFPCSHKTLLLQKPADLILDVCDIVLADRLPDDRHAAAFNQTVYIAYSPRVAVSASSPMNKGADIFCPPKKTNPKMFR